MSCLAAMSRWLKFRQVILLLLLIMAVGSLLRIYDLATESICLDEAVGINFSAYHGVGSIIEEAAVTQSPLSISLFSTTGQTIVWKQKARARPRIVYQSYTLDCAVIADDLRLTGV